MVRAPAATGHGGARTVVEAAVAIVAEHGLGGASVRKVAARAGVSPGLVQHHFPTRHALLRAAMAHVEDAVARRLYASGAERAPAERLQALAAQVVPLDEARAVEARVWLAFVAAASTDPVLAAAHGAGWQRLEGVVAGLLAAHHGRVDPGTDDRDRAALLLAALDGLAATAVSEPDRLPPERTRRLVDRLVEGFLRPPGPVRPDRAALEQGRDADL